MKMMMEKLKRGRQGFALLMVLIFTSLGLLLMTAAMSWTSNSSLLNERSNQYNASMLAAEAASEKVMTAMLNDFKNYGQPGLANNLNNYKTRVPNASESSYWNDFQFSDGQGNTGKVYVASSGSAYFTNDLASPYAGLGGTRIPYKIVANAKLTSSRFNFTNAVQQEVAFTTVPIFQFAIFYNSLLEFTQCAPMNIRGKIHANGDIYVGTLSGSSLDCWQDVTATGVIAKPAWWGFSASDWSGSVTFHGETTTNAASLALPVGTNNTAAAVHKIIERPEAGELPTSDMGTERYYNKAEILILVTNGAVTVGVKNPYSTTSNNVVWSQASYFVSTNKSLYDQREADTELLTEIDVTKFKTWAATNAAVSSVLGGATPSLIYVDDTRGGYTYTTNTVITTNDYTSSTYPGNGVGTVSTNLSDWTPSRGTSRLPASYYDYRVYSTSRRNGTKYQYREYEYTYYTYSTNYVVTRTGSGSAVRLVNGQTLPSNGLTVATPNGLYVKGNYNCPTAAYLGTTNTTDVKPASFVADAVTILSGSWDDTLSSGSLYDRTASNTTVNAAIVSGNVPTGADGISPKSGGVHNLPRLLENWGDGSKTLTINGSLVCLFQSTRASGNFIGPGESGEYYRAPTRNWSFDNNFLDPNKLPPGTPAVRILERLSWSNPRANTVN